MIETSKVPILKVTIESGSADCREFSFTERFCIGRHPDCEIQIKEIVVSRRHAEVFFENGQWWIHDLKSSNGIFNEGLRMDKVSLSGGTNIRLGVSGPILVFSIQKPISAKTQKAQPSAMVPPSLSHYKQHYFGNIQNESAGEHTMMVRRAYADVKKKQRLTYLTIISVFAILLFISAAIAFYKHKEVVQQRKLAEEIFYSMRTLEINYLNLRMDAEKRRSMEAKKQIDEFKVKKQHLGQSYARYLETLKVYGKGFSEKDRAILRMANRLGECEITIPQGFTDKVTAFIEKWKSTGRLERAIRGAKNYGYIPKITEILSKHDLPPEFFYLALQESNLNPKACGPPTRFGIAKGMWQFIPATAEKYGLRIGPLKNYPIPDEMDERHSFLKSTQAAARYLRDIYATDAQASGLLVMAAYNWGENRVVKLLRTMPSNPRERNFWELISKYGNNIPDETYDYVFSIFSAAVIGENPRLFGFDFDNPLSTDNAHPPT
jgi:hypothetical protein